jgi:TRAP transporter 4TM/12TM fusion protein
MKTIKVLLSRLAQLHKDDKKRGQQNFEEHEEAKWLTFLRFGLAGGWVFFQFYIIFYPLVPMVQRPLHVAFAVALVFLFRPIKARGFLRFFLHLVDLCFAAISLSIGLYFVYHKDRILERIVFVDDVLPADIVLCIFLVVLLIEATRRTVGMSLLLVTVAFLIYGWFGYLFPGWLNFKGIGLQDYIEVLFLGDSGIYGIPVETSLRYVFYFVAFGAIFAAVGGSRLLIDLGLKLTRKQKGGAAKAAVITSSLMGTVSGSAVANVTTTGVFTIPFMLKSGYDRETAGATEAIASTGGQLMPPIMGVGAFVMAELLDVPYLRIALAAVIPALLFYLSLFCLIDFRARKSGIGVMRLDEDMSIIKIGPRIHLFLPVIVVVWFIVRGYTPTFAAFWGCVSAVVVSFIRKETRPNLSGIIEIINSTGRQASSVAIPIATIGIIIGVAIQSGLAMKFSTRLMHISGGSLAASFGFIIAGCIILGMGLPTVAAYIIGAVFFIPPLIKFGFLPLAAHLFVFYFSILAMVTPPVALASFTAAGLAQGNVTGTGIKAFMMSFVAFLIPFVYIFNPALLWFGSLKAILMAGFLSAGAVVVWSAALAGYLKGNLHIIERVLFSFVSFGLFFAVKESLLVPGVGLLALVFLWNFLVKPRLKPFSRALADR